MLMSVLCVGALWRTAELPQAQSTLAGMADAAASKLKAADQRVTCVEATTGGLIQASLIATAGASKVTTCGAIAYTSSRAVAVLGAEEAQPLNEPLDSTGHRSKPKNGDEYIASKQERVALLARKRRIEAGATWCICENGASGPTFAYDDLSTGFTAIFVSGPVEKGVLIKSSHNRREENMYGFAQAALDLLAECVAEASGIEDTTPPPPTLLDVVEDRYGGVEVSVNADVPFARQAFVDELRSSLSSWIAGGKRGVWLTLPTACHAYVSAAIESGFEYHHATPEYLQLVRWLPIDTPSPLPRYAFTLIGVGGVVVNSDGKVLMVQERVSPSARMQGSWKLPGGLADPGEDFADTVAREVREETGIDAVLDGVVSMRHAHGRRFGQGDLYVVVKLKASGAEEISIDEGELADAKWMGRDEIEAMREQPEDKGQSLSGKVSGANYEMISSALDGQLIEGVEITSSNGKQTLLYRAPRGE